MTTVPISIYQSHTSYNPYVKVLCPLETVTRSAFIYLGPLVVDFFLLAVVQDAIDVGSAPVPTLALQGLALDVLLRVYVKIYLLLENIPSVIYVKLNSRKCLFTKISNEYKERYLIEEERA